MYTIYNTYAICTFAAIGKYRSFCTQMIGLVLTLTGGGLFGFDISSMSGVLGTNGYKIYFYNPVSYRQGGITASMPAGSLFGALASSYIADRLSRKVAIQVASIIWIIGSM